jgi:hypothetical protein
MKSLSKELKRTLVFTAAVSMISIAYYLYALLSYPPVKESETFLSEVGEGFGEVGLWLLVFIYFRTVIKLLLGKGPISKRLLPEYSPPIDPKYFHRFIHFLDRTHIYVGVSAVAIILLHIVLMGMPMKILFFPAVLFLVIWQGVFGMFISWRYAPEKLKEFSYLVHAQLFTGIMIGIFAYLGHVLIDD